MTTTAAATTAIDFFKELFAHTEEPVYICSFTNERGEGGERHVMTRLPAQINGFVSKWDKPGRGTFFCVSAVDPDASKRNKETVRKTTCLHADIDFKLVDVREENARDECLQKLARLKYPPSMVVFSGGGLHCYWLFKEPIETQANIERIEAALKQLADVVAGDPSCCEIARVLRVPGTHNTKEGAWTEVEVLVFEPSRRYDLDDLEEWFAEQSPVMLLKAREHAMPAGETDFFTEYAKQHGIKAPIDVEQRLAGMMFMGGVDSSVHQTQLAVTAALLNRGVPKDDVVTVVLDATKRAAGEYGPRWNWRREERKLHGMCDTWLKKNPPDKRKERAYQESVERATLVGKGEPAGKVELKSIEGGKTDAPAAPPKNQVRTTTDGVVVTMPVIIANEDPHVQLGRAVLAAFAAAGEELINIKDGSWFYSGSVWELHVDVEWLNVKIEDACVRVKFKSNTKLINETRNWIKRRPELWRKADDIPWDEHGKIPTRSGLVDPTTGELEPARPDHYCTWRVEVDYGPAEKCPWWATMIADMFGDKPDDEREALVGVVQELIGAALIDRKARGLRKACVFWGNENRAKSGVLEVVSGLFGDKPITAAIGTVDGTHGLMPFVRRAPWVLHEAFTGQWHMSATVKAIVTGEPVQINIKNGPMMQQIVRAPIFWATNFQPQFKEATRAIVNRMIVIEVTRAFDDKKPVGAAAEAIKRGFATPGAFVVAAELPGILNWAIAGLARALERGSIASTAGIDETAKAIHQDSNLVAGFIEDCIGFDPMARLRVADFCLAHSAWFMESKGEDRRLPTNESISKALKALGDARIGMHSKEMRDTANRYYCGIAFNRVGLRYHRAAFESRLFEGKTASVIAPDREVNGTIPTSWDTRPSVAAMRAQHGPNDARAVLEDDE